jgi:hypothetical protein
MQSLVEEDEADKHGDASALNEGTGDAHAAVDTDGSGMTAQPDASADVERTGSTPTLALDGTASESGPEGEQDSDDGGANADDEDDGTPIEGVRIAPAPVVSSENAFVAGEIDVPAAPSQRASSEPDTGTRTPSLERRSS